MGPADLIEHPELGALAILRSSLEVAHLALVATYENCEPFAADGPRTEQEAFAISILNLGDALEALLVEYFESVHRSPCWRRSSADDPES